jgi:hypothetical protein
VIDKDNDEKAAPNLARLFAFAALLVFGAVTLAWWGFLAWLFWHVIVVAVHDGSSGLRNGVMLAPSGSPPILPSGDLMQPIAAGGQFVGFGWNPKPRHARGFLLCWQYSGRGGLRGTLCARAALPQYGGDMETGV